MTDFKQRVECLKELEKHVMPLNWETFGAANEKIVDANGLFVAETCSDDDAAFIVAIRNNGVPLLQEMQAENERLQSALTVQTWKKEDYHAEIERLRAGIALAANNLSDMRADVEQFSDLLDNLDYRACQLIQDALKELEALQ